MSDKVLVTKSKLVDVADAIREKVGTQAEMTIDEMATAVENLPSGSPVLVTGEGTPTTEDRTYVPGTGRDGFSSFVVKAIPSEYVVPSGSVELTDNGTYNVSGKAQAVVNVPTGGYTINDIFDSSQPIGDIVFNGTQMSAAYTQARTGITKFTALNLTSHLAGMFQNCSALRYVIIPNVNTFDNNMFRYCESLIGGDFSTTNISTAAFYNDSQFDLLILRNTNAVASLGSTNALSGTPFASGGTGGTLYVPQALIASYQSATNWSTILSNENNQILPIEGSIYETKYADGTPIS